jgi:KAP-like P-loop domain-containing protein
MDADMEWLLGQIPGRDTLGLEETKAAAIIDIVQARDRSTLPVTIGLFGTWGSGKTTTLGYVARRLMSNTGFVVIYFNAWKYAGFMEPVPALIYKVLMAASSASSEPVEKVLGQIMLGLGKKYADALGEWTKLLTQVDLIKVARDLADVRNVIEGATHPAAAAAKQYYTQLDRSQDLLAEACRKSSPVIVVLIDELDRCDPGEAFDIIKQLRVFFTMRRVPIVFVLAVNADPIGQAIKHQFGLSSEWGDYEARRILEKFVDHYVEMGATRSIVDYVRSIWAGAGLDLEEACFIARADSQLQLPPYDRDTVKHASFNECMLADNPIYANRRLLAKCLSRLKAKRHETAVPWTAWHLEIVAQAYPTLRETMATLSRQLVAVAEAAHRGVIEELHRNGCLAADGRVVKGSLLKSDKGAAAFAAYRSLFWERLREQPRVQREGDSERSQRRADLLDGLLADHRKVDFVATALMQGLGPIRFAGNTSLEGWHEVFKHGHLGWVLSNY